MSKTNKKAATQRTHPGCRLTNSAVIWVHPNIYSTYKLLESMEEWMLQIQIQEKVITSESENQKWGYDQSWHLPL